MIKEFSNKNIRKNPLISVVMPVYNGGIFLKMAIESILNQSYRNFELIIINDGSTDISKKIISKYIKFDKRVKVLNFDKPHGFGGEVAANFGIKMAKGKYIAKMDSDDIAISNRLEKTVVFLENNKDIFLVGGQMHIINNIGKVVGKRLNPCESVKIRNNMYLKNCISHPTVMFRNEFKKDDFYKIDFESFNDYNTWVDLICDGKKIANLPDFVLYYRIHKKNVTYTNIKNKFDANAKIKDKYLMNIKKVPYSHRIIIEIQKIVVKILPEYILQKLNKSFYFLNYLLTQ